MVGRRRLSPSDDRRSASRARSPSAPPAAPTCSPATIALTSSRQASARASERPSAPRRVRAANAAWPRSSSDRRRHAAASRAPRRSSGRRRASSRPARCRIRRLRHDHAADRRRRREIEVGLVGRRRRRAPAAAGKTYAASAAWTIAVNRNSLAGPNCCHHRRGDQRPDDRADGVGEERPAAVSTEVPGAAWS